jgi:hypothetical protein
VERLELLGGHHRSPCWPPSASASRLLGAESFFCIDGAESFFCIVFKVGELLGGAGQASFFAPRIAPSQPPHEEGEDIDAAATATTTTVGALEGHVLHPSDLLAPQRRRVGRI